MKLPYNNTKNGKTGNENANHLVYPLNNHTQSKELEIVQAIDVMTHYKKPKTLIALQCAGIPLVSQPELVNYLCKNRMND